MLKIALVDDEKEFIELERVYIEQAFSKLIDEFTIYTFFKGDEFLEAYQNEMFDFVFLDIDLLNFSGFDIAETIRSYGNNTDIVFVSNHDHFVFNSLDYQPIQFVRKQFLIQGLKKSITLLVKKLKNQKRHISIVVSSMPRKIMLDDIICFESNKHILQVRTVKEDISFRGRISDKEIELRDYNFIRIHSGFLVNLKHVVSIGKDFLQLEDGTSLPVSRNRMKDTKNAFQRYLRNQV